MSALFPITITVHTIEQLDRVRALFYDEVKNKNVPTPSPNVKTSTPPPTEKPATASTDVKDGRPFTADEASAYTNKLLTSGKKPWVLEQIVTKYGKKNAKQLDDAQRAEYMAAALAAFPDITP